MADESNIAYYTKLRLWIYDIEVLWFNTRFIWNCSTAGVLLPLFKSCIGRSHLDIGVGTGYYPSHAVRTEKRCEKVTLMDVNPTTIDVASRRVRSARSDVEVRSLVANALEPLPLPEEEKFDSISMYYLLHCINASPEEKTKAFDVARGRLNGDGVLSGATVLGREAPMNWIARWRMRMYNESGVFHNWEDSRGVFEEGLRRNFEEVDVQVLGRLLVWTARKPKQF